MSWVLGPLYALWSPLTGITVTEYLDRRKLLQTPAEQSRLLSKIPKVMPEEVKPDIVIKDSPDVLNQEADDPSKATLWDWEPCYLSLIHI